MNQTTVWLVEDETSISEALSYVMQLEGFTVRTFERGLPALDAARQTLP
ncbi:two-component system response regulator CreB, partial [Cronobacter malonaticus]|nr:two-component system response regulator CreB [Cronobacter malonaticus]